MTSKKLSRLWWFVIDGCRGFCRIWTPADRYANFMYLVHIHDNRDNPSESSVVCSEAEMLYYAHSIYWQQWENDPFEELLFFLNGSHKCSIMYIVSIQDQEGSDLPKNLFIVFNEKHMNLIISDFHSKPWEVKMLPSCLTWS